MKFYNWMFTHIITYNEELIYQSKELIYYNSSQLIYYPFQQTLCDRIIALRFILFLNNDKVCLTLLSGNVASMNDSIIL